ncbi:Uncharacterised protein [Candidatus Norongarragalina meridionalis]|nr:Uncharacterised protein [Candidatus Norongarragalina meridionalis]
MKFSFVLLGLAFVAAGVAALTTVPCFATYNMGSATNMSFNSCAISDLIPNAGGSAVIVHNGIYCVKTVKFYTEFILLHRINVQLLKGPSCGPWQPGDFCYGHMTLGDYCNKYWDPGTLTDLGDYTGLMDGLWVAYHYIAYQNAYGDYRQSFPAGILYNNTILTGSLWKDKVSRPVATVAKTRSRH